MDVIRILLAVILFCISSYLVYDLFANGFSWSILLCCLSGYVLTHCIWPKKAAEYGGWYDAFEIIIDLPYRVIALVVRSIGRVVRSSDGDIGIDL